MDPDLPGLDNSGAPLPDELARALAAQGPDYRPRTEHITADGAPRFTNRLVCETSPYLLQHAHNPVNWHPWGEEAFTRAREGEKLLLLSVGYSTCHWCHVMEHESFEDLEIAAFINRHFVPVKVDREERPDVDGVYMAAVQMMTGGGGWPMTVMLTPERDPVFGGTYFPARDGDRGTGIGFLTILRELARAWAADPKRFARAGRDVRERVRAMTGGGVPGEVPGADAIHRATGDLWRAFDTRSGGFGGAPKFPRSVTLELLARVVRRTNDEDARTMLEETLLRMAAGGICDQVGGGFHRYSVDAQWLVPHFEKMLYDNAQLAVAYLEGYQLTGRAELAQTSRDILNYLRREMTHEGGAFYAATDADSARPDGRLEEGVFFTWTPAELAQVLGEERAERVAVAYGVSPQGNFEGRNILHLSEPVENVARMLDLSVADLAADLAVAREQLRAARSRRPPPLLDTKIVTSWNGLAISAFARVGHALDVPDYVEAAARAAEFLRDHLLVGGELRRTWKDGQARFAAVLDDYGFLTQGLLDLYEAGGDAAWLRLALDLQLALDERFHDGQRGGYFFTGDGGEELLARDKPGYDGAEPCGNSVAALNLLRFEQLTGERDYRERAEGVFAAHASQLAGGGALPKMLVALDYYLDRPLQVVVVTGDAEETAAMLAPVREAFLPNRVLLVGNEAALAAQESLVPLVAGKERQQGRATAYVCRGHVCDLPTTDPAVLRRELGEADPLPGSAASIGWKR
jgi:uncharacterized protein YyaL (SSP411 family)